MDRPNVQFSYLFSHQEQEDSNMMHYTYFPPPYPKSPQCAIIFSYRVHTPFQSKLLKENSGNPL